MKIMKSIPAVLALCATSLAAGTASAQVIFPGDGNIYWGEVDLDGDTGAWECEIRCGGLLDVKTVLGYRFIFWNGFGYQSTQ